MPYSPSSEELEKIAKIRDSKEDRKVPLPETAESTLVKPDIDPSQIKAIEQKVPAAAKLPLQKNQKKEPVPAKARVTVEFEPAAQGKKYQIGRVVRT